MATIAGILAIAGCASLPHPTPDDAARAAVTWPGATIASLEADRARYVAKCSSCHALPRPDRYPAERWSRWLDQMRERAKLTADDRESVLRYLVTLASRRN